MSEINITYETLYEILRNERNREDLQELSMTFYEDVIEYLKKNKKMLDDDILTNAPEDEKEDHTRQLKNIKNIIKEIYERREKKIINMAVNKSRTKSESLETETLLAQEKEMYERFVEILDCFRDNILSRTLRGKIPLANERTCSVDYQQERATEYHSIPGSTSHREDNKTEDNKTEVAKTEEQKEESEKDGKESDAIEKSEEKGIEKEEERKKAERANGRKNLKFREHIPKFLGKELEVYGPYEADETAALPTELANILIRKGKAEEIVD